MDLEGIMLSKITHMEKKSLHMISLHNMSYKKKTEKISEQTKQKEACKSRVQSSSYQKGRGGYGRRMGKAELYGERWKLTFCW